MINNNWSEHTYILPKVFYEVYFSVVPDRIKIKDCITGLSYFNIATGELVIYNYNLADISIGMIREYRINNNKFLYAIKINNGNISFSDFKNIDNNNINYSKYCTF